MLKLFKELAPHFYVIFGEGGLGASELFSSHSYLFVGEKKVILVDPGSTAHGEQLREALPQLGVSGQQIDLVIVTHEHWDHISATDNFPDAEHAASEAALEALNEQDDDVVRHKNRGQTYTSQFDRGLKDGEVVDLGNFQLNVLLTPGHTPGSLCLYEPGLKILLTGDTFFGGGSISRIFMEGGRALHVKSLERIAGLELEAIYPGHGDLIEGRQSCLDNIEISLARAQESLRQGE